MKRESLITKLVAFMLCVMMVVGCLPVSAFAANDWEGPMDDYTYPAGSQENPIIITLTYNEENTVGTYEAAAQEGTTYYQAYMNGDYEFAVAGEGDFNVVIGDNTIAAVDGVASTTVSGLNRFTPFEFAIDGSGEFTVTFSIPVGAQMNPEELVLGYNDVSLAEGDTDGYYYTWTAAATGDLSFNIETITEGVEADILINNNTSYVNKTLAENGVANDFGTMVVTMPVTAGDEISIQVVVMPDDSYSYPAADITHYSTFTYPLGSEQNPIWPDFVWNDAQTEATATVTVAAGETVYYQGRLTDMYMTINDGEAVACTGNMWAPYVWSITNEGTEAAEYVIKVAYPVGSSFTPAIAKLGDNAAAIAEGNETGYFWTYTAEKAGDLVFNFSSNDGNWTYTINNMTTYVYGEQQWSDSDPVVNPATITVAEGDEIQIIVNTYDPASYVAPAGTVTFNMEYKEEVVLPDGEATLKFAGASLTLESSLTINFKVKPQVLDAYDDVYAVFAMKHGDEVTEITITEEDAYLLSGRYFFDFAGVAANWMNCDVTAVLYGTFEGKQYQSDVATYSVAQYCKNMLPRYQNTAGYEEFCTMLVDLLNYGALAQEYTKFETGNLVNSWLTEEQLALGTSTMPEMNSIRDMNYVTVENAKIRFRGAALVLDYAVVVRLIVNVLDGDISDYVIKVKTDREVFTIDTLEFASYRSDDGTAQYYAYFDKMYATEMSEPMEVTVYQDGVAVSNTLLYSIESYVGDNYDKSAGTPYLQELLVAMLRYGNSAEAYLG